MAPSVDHLISAVENRLSCYTLTNKSPISDSRVQEIVNAAVKNAPSAFNVQSARAVVLLKRDHEKLWDLGDECLKKAMPEAAYQALAPRVQGFKEAYGTVLFCEDQSALDGLKDKNPGIQHVIRDWSLHSSGMHQFIVWTALELEGLGCNLQHYNFMTEFSDQVRQTWNLPNTWELHCQLVFGQPKDGLKRSRERTYLPLEEERVKIFGS
ncbi:hypothetical protein H2204_001474 [Knufia peltigerae]|uniref:Nitroreductase domain-containing protein n=1 Tax=Knufia peltigerae TaxID=1002370 RepID=A0AA38YDB4_9EURO|nr:hypothetical protein H2204_001474 [Knufia peltigerae]